jgi:carboxynorspermidine decarboxylase
MPSRAGRALATPYYLLDERRLLRNLRIADRLRRLSGARLVLALKCFSTWSVFPLMARFLDGTTSSGVYEARLGREKFGKEVHAYSVGYSREDVRAVRRVADKIIFNSLSQLRAFAGEARGLDVGVRVNPGFSYSHFDLADPARRRSRLGVRDGRALRQALGHIRGVMFHFNCENGDVRNVERNLARLGRDYGDVLERLDWVSLGGGLAFTRPGYPLARLARALKTFAARFGVQVYLEPGDALVADAADLVATVLDVVHNEADIAIVDAGVEAHFLDHLIYRTSPPLVAPRPGRFRYVVAGRSCLAGDVFGEYRVRTRLRPGSRVRFGNAAAYTMVKTNWFNGLPMPAIVVRRLNGRLEIVRTFGYQDFVDSLS